MTRLSDEWRKRKPTDKQVIVALIVVNAAMTLVMAAFLLTDHAWWEGVMWLINLWGNGGVTVALTRNYMDGVYG